ncbi:OsmC family protein [uncultured Paenalcaligenes sp.]|uniref:OsmC family protein n=1 Tax=uncultured Paenalcaligenes sp. TaxID=1588925 RepID=UPI0026314626|nr:OsmC family protein [uncultured Paenalcaligenes sp.]
MAVQQVKTSAHLQNGTVVQVSARGFQFVLDEPVDLGGTNTGMNPVEALLGALGACQAIVARVYAQKFGVQLDDFRVELEGDLDLDGFLDKADVRCGFTEVRYHYYIKSPSPKAAVDEFVTYIAEKCPVGDCLANGVVLKAGTVTIES